MLGGRGYIVYRLTDSELRVFALGTESVVLGGAPAREWRASCGVARRTSQQQEPRGSSGARGDRTLLA